MQVEKLKTPYNSKTYNNNLPNFIKDCNAKCQEGTIQKWKYFGIGINDNDEIICQCGEFKHKSGMFEESHCSIGSLEVTIDPNYKFPACGTSDSWAIYATHPEPTMQEEAFEQGVNNNNAGNNFMKSNMKTVCDTLKEYGGIDCMVYIKNNNDINSITFKVDEYFNELESKGMTITNIKINVIIQSNSQQQMIDVVDAFRQVSNPGKLSNIFALKWMAQFPAGSIYEELYNYFGCITVEQDQIYPDRVG